MLPLLDLLLALYNWVLVCKVRFCIFTKPDSIGEDALLTKNSQ